MRGTEVVIPVAKVTQVLFTKVDCDVRHDDPDVVFFHGRATPRRMSRWLPVSQTKE